MNEKRLAIEIELLRISKPIVDQAIASNEKIAKQLRQVNEIKIALKESKWQGFQDDTYGLLLKMARIGEEYEERKTRLINGRLNLEQRLDKNTTVRFDKNANCIIINKKDNIEVL